MMMSIDVARFVICACTYQHRWINRLLSINQCRLPIPHEIKISTIPMPLSSDLGRFPESNT